MPNEKRSSTPERRATPSQIAKQNSNFRARQARKAGGAVGGIVSAGGGGGGTGGGGGGGGGGVPAAPVIDAASQSGPGEASIAWTASAGATSYKVQRTVDDGATWTQIAAGVAASPYIDSSPAYGTEAKYRVLATNATGDSAPSAASNAVMVM
jgi:hypothetical protein